MTYTSKPYDNFSRTVKLTVDGVGRIADNWNGSFAGDTASLGITIDGTSPEDVTDHKIGDTVQIDGQNYEILPDYNHNVKLKLI